MLSSPGIILIAAIRLAVVMGGDEEEVATRRERRGCPRRCHAASTYR
jgi:hypothetical protein